jgi:CRISPR-associated protein Csd1
MILSELQRRYERLRDAGELPAFGFSVEKVVGAIVIGGDGRYISIENLRTDVVLRPGKTVRRPASLVVPQPPRRTVKILPGFLCDGAGYLFGLAEPGREARAAEQFAASRARHEAVLGGLDHPAARAVLAFFAAWVPGAAPADADPELLQGWLVFQRDGDLGFVHEVPEIRAAWEAAAAADGEEEPATGQCLATGESGVAVARIHPAVKGVPGAQTAGAALVSFNAPAYESYGLTQNYNAPVSAAVAHGYTTALNDLLAQRGRRHVTVGDVSVVFWTDAPSAAEEDLGFLLTAPPAPPPEDAALAAEIQGRLDRLSRGREAYPIDQRDVPFFVLGLSANAARVSVRFWARDTLGAMADKVARHLRDIELVTQYPGENPRPSVRALADETKTKYGGSGRDARPDPDDKGIAKLNGEILRAVLTGGPYPASLQAVLLDRMRADRVVNHRRVALLKAVLLRKGRLAGRSAPEEGDRLVSLDEDRNDPGYLLGRLFAVLERLQQIAAEGRELNATIRDRHVGAASATPKAVFPHLLRLSLAHLKRARADRPGQARALEARVEEIHDRLADFPATLDLDQRGLFFLGYYHERRWLWTKRAAGPEAPGPAGDTPSDTSLDATTDTAIAVPE